MPRPEPIALCCSDPPMLGSPPTPGRSRPSPAKDIGGSGSGYPGRRRERLSTSRPYLPERNRLAPAVARTKGLRKVTNNQPTLLASDCVSPMIRENQSGKKMMPRAADA